MRNSCRRRRTKERVEGEGRVGGCVGGTGRRKEKKRENEVGQES